VAGTYINDWSLGAVAQHCTQLETLCLSGCKWVTSVGLLFMAPYCTNLTELHLEFCTKVTDDVIISLISTCKKLKRVNVALTEVTDIGKEALQSAGIESISSVRKLSWEP